MRLQKIQILFHEKFVRKLLISRLLTLLARSAKTLFILATGIEILANEDDNALFTDTPKEILCNSLGYASLKLLAFLKGWNDNVLFKEFLVSTTRKLEKYES